MTKYVAIALATAGVVWLGAQAPANAASRDEGMSNATRTAFADDMSARRRHRRVVVRRYEAPRYYGYYGPVYYDRPYARPARSPWGFWPGGWW